MIELTICLESAFRREIDENVFNGNTTFGDVIRCVETPFSAPPDPHSSIRRNASARVRIVRRLVLPFVETVIFRILLGVNVTATGKPRVGRRESVIFIANHQSHLDTTSIIFSLPSRLRLTTAVAAADDFFFSNRSLLNRVSAILLNLFPFNRINNFTMNFVKIGALLDQGISVLIYPEGTRSKDGTMAQFKGGIGAIVKEMGVPVVPIGVKNGFNLLPHNRSLPRRGTVEVRFGEKLSFSGKSAEEITEALERAVRSLCG
jgi:long-chain acyl-CoA synthetase